MEETPPRKSSLGSRIAFALRPKKSKSTLRKKVLDEKPLPPPPPPPERRIQYGAVYRNSQDNTDEQTGERRDDTELLHGLAHHESNDSLDEVAKLQSPTEAWRPPGEPLIASLPSGLWEAIASHLALSDIANLTISSKVLFSKFGPGPWIALDEPENRDEKLKFLMSMDQYLPAHLLCFSCASFHLRTQVGQERLKATSVFNPLYHCPSVGKSGHVQPRIRLVVGHTLPYTFVQLVMRHEIYSPNHGIPIGDLSRRFSTPDSNWSHQTRYFIHKGHLLMRVVSKSFATPNLPPSGLRHLLYSREDYTPYFSACAHWRDGELMNVCKCALGHIPEHKQTIAQQLQKGPAIKMALRNPTPIVSLCSRCRPMRRCPECPSEYLVELKLSEDRNDPLVKFKQSIVVTRWSDLGDGSSPFTPEWSSINGETDYQSFEKMGRRAISGVFEAQSGVTMPGQRMLSLNPKNEKLGEEGHNWY